MRAKAPNRIDPCRICKHKRTCQTYADLKQAEESQVKGSYDEALVEWCDLTTYDKQLQIRLDCKRFEEEWDAT